MDQQKKIDLAAKAAAEFLTERFDIGAASGAEPLLRQATTYQWLAEQLVAAVENGDRIYEERADTIAATVERNHGMLGMKSGMSPPRPGSTFALMAALDRRASREEVRALANAPRTAVDRSQEPFDSIPGFLHIDLEQGVAAFVNMRETKAEHGHIPPLNGIDGPLAPWWLVGEGQPMDVEFIIENWKPSGRRCDLSGWAASVGDPKRARETSLVELVNGCTQGESRDSTLGQAPEVAVKS